MVFQTLVHAAHCVWVLAHKLSKRVFCNVLLHELVLASQCMHMHEAGQPLTGVLERSEPC